MCSNSPRRGNPALVYLTNVDADGKPDPASAGRGTVWHTDSTYKAAPCAHTVLYALQIPSQGGGTIFADMARAYDALPADTKARIEDLRAVHSFGQGPAEGGIIPLTPAQRKAMPPVEHPIVRTHPHSGRKSLYVNPLHCCGIVGMEDGPAMDLLMDLFEHALQPKFQYHHAWRVGELVIWDQRCTMHRGAGDAPPARAPRADAHQDRRGGVAHIHNSDRHARAGGHPSRGLDSRLRGSDAGEITSPAKIPVPSASAARRAANI